MRVHRIDVEQVVLHLPDDAAEGRQIPSEHVVAVHAPQRMGEACAIAEHLDETGAIDGIGAKGCIDATGGSP